MPGVSASAVDRRVVSHATRRLHRTGLMSFDTMHSTLVKRDLETPGIAGCRTQLKALQACQDTTGFQAGDVYV